MTPAGGHTRRPARRWIVVAAVAAVAAGVMAVAAWTWLGGPDPSAPVATAGAAPQISGRVVLAPALQSRVEQGDSVIIEARLLDGPRMPVASLKRRASELPLEFKLDASTVTTRTLRLSPSMPLVVSARVSRSGLAAPGPGDWQGTSQPVAVGARDVLIEINETIR